MSLDSQTKEKIYSRVCELVTRKHFDPGMNGANWEELSKARKDQILQSNSDEEFEKQIQELLSELKTSHTGFRHSKSSKIPGRHAISATFMRCNFDGDAAVDVSRCSRRWASSCGGTCVRAIFSCKSEIVK